MGEGLTKEQEEHYLKNKGAFCPFCGTNDIVADSLEPESDFATGRVSCQKCGREWTDCYTLTGICL